MRYRANRWRTKRTGFCLSIKTLDFTQKNLLFDLPVISAVKSFAVLILHQPSISSALMSILIFLICLPFKTVGNISFRWSLYLLLSCPSIPEKRKLFLLNTDTNPLFKGHKLKVLKPFFAVLHSP